MQARRGPHVVRPADVVPVQQPGDVGPDVRTRRPIRGDPCLAVIGSVASRELQVRSTTHRIAEVGARRRPARHQEQMGGKRPRRLGREHVVLQHEVLRVRPVVRDLGGGVIAHDVRLAARTPLGLPALEDVGMVLAPVADLLQRPDEPVHPRAVSVDRRAHRSVGATRVEAVRVVVGPSTDTGLRIGDADVDVAVRVPRESVRAGERAEVVIERAVLLHDHDDVGDVVDADVGIDRRIRGGHGYRRRRGRCANGGHGSLAHAMHARLTHRARHSHDGHDARGHEGRQGTCRGPSGSHVRPDATRSCSSTGTVRGSGRGPAAGPATA